ncbi:type VI secretion system protein TssA [Burkholderia pyrrocinia]
MTMNIESMEDLGRTNIGPVASGDVCVRDDARFDALQAELAKLASPGASSQIHWDRAVDLAAELLRDRGKDLLVGCYLAGALLYVSGAVGLRCGLLIVGDLIECHWDTMSPDISRMRARRGALRWLVDRVEAALDERFVARWGAYPRELVEQLRAAARRIDTLLSERDEDAPSMRAVRAFADMLSVESEVVDEMDAMPDEVEETDAANGQANSSSKSDVTELTTTPPSIPLDNEAARERAIEDTSAHLHRLATAVAQADWTDARSFRLRRFACWMNVGTLPDAQADTRRTRIAAPNAQIVDVAKGIEANCDPVDAIRFAEGHVQAFPLWLDLQRIAALALGRWGDGGVAAQQEIKTATCALLARVPGLEALKFADGTPFADDDTIAWLGRISMAACDPNRDNLEVPDEPNDGPDDTVDRARTLAAGGRLDLALRMIQDAIDRSASAEYQLRLRIRLCELVRDHWAHTKSDVFAHRVIESIRRHDLLAWDPELALDGLSAAYTLLTRRDRESLDALPVFDDIAKLDAARAMQLLN